MQMATTHHLPTDRSLPLMGSDVRIVVGPPVRAGVLSPPEAADAVEGLLREYDATLSRFRPDSELSRLNVDPREVVPASALLRAAVHAALEAAELSGGLVDPALLDGVEAAGYRGSFEPGRRLDLRRALREASGARRAAHPDPRARWRFISVDDVAGTVTRPVGLRLDTGGTGKGHAADLAAELLDGYAFWMVDCGGDVRVGGDGGSARVVNIADPFTGDVLEGLSMRQGAAATSALRARIWRGPTGEVAHHLIDPSIGRPILTGLIAVTALAPTAVRAEALALAAMLSGPNAAPRLLERHGGIAFDDAGREHRFGPLSRASRTRLAVGL
jgi:thiamine biosynthesis lipoprotein